MKNHWNNNLKIKMLKAEIENILSKPPWQVFIAVTIFYVLGLFMFSHFVWSTDIYEFNYKAKVGFENYIDMVRRIDIVRYLLSPAYIFAFSIISIGLIKIGLIEQNIKINNRILFKIILLGFFVLSLPLWVKTIWFVFVNDTYVMDEVKYFYPVSILFFFDAQELNIKVVKALGRINLYHLAYIFFIASCLRIYTNASLLRLSLTVFLTYGLGFILLQLIMILIFL